MGDLVAINVVFTDLVGSTELSSRLGPEATEALRVIHFDLLRTAAAAHEGTEVKNLGDGLMLVFPSLTASLDASVSMQQAIERHNSSGGEPLGIRVGVSAGDATAEDGDYFGEPVVEAARLCAKCEAGQIIASEFTSMMARKSGHVFESIGELELRGVPAPVPSVLVGWEAVQAEAAMTMPDRLRPDMEYRLAGRVEQTDALAQAFKMASSGDRRAVLLAGEPGIGKTRLSSELAVSVHETGAAVLYGRCDEELSVPYQPWVEAITYLFDHAPQDLAAQLVERHGPELAQLVPQLRWQHPDMRTSANTDAETERYLVLQAVTASLGMLAERNPVLLVLDDLHWADKQTLTLLRHVFTNLPANAPVMVIGTYRDSDLDGGHPLLDTAAALRREAGVDLIKLSGLDDLEMVQLVEISGGQELDEAGLAMVTQLRQETAGNPFFAHEILRNMVESGDLYVDDDGRWRVKGGLEVLALPQSVKDVVSQRMARLGEESLKALTAASVIGRQFDLALLSGITGVDEDDLLDQLEGAVAAGILAEVPGGQERFVFLHTLARTTLASSLSDGRARRMHRKIAEALETEIGDDPGERVGELATHWMAAAAPIDEVKAISYARLAGQRALRALAPDEALRWFTMALEHLELGDGSDDATRAGILVELGTAQQHLGEPAYRETLLDAGKIAAGLGDTTLMVAAALANNRGLYSKLGSVDQERIDALQAALEAVGNDATAERALLLATLFGELENAADLEERLRLINEATAIARDIGDQWALATVLNRSMVTSAAPHTLADRSAAGVESLEIAVELGDMTLEFWARYGNFYAALGRMDNGVAQEMLETASALAAEIGHPSLRWMAGNMACSFQYVCGSPEELEALTTESYERGVEAGEPDAFDFYGAHLLGARFIGGRSMEIMDSLKQTAADLPEIRAFSAAAAMMIATEGDPEEARGYLLADAERGFDTRVNNSWGVCMNYWGMAAAMLDERELAASLYDRILPWAGQRACTQISVGFSFDGVLGRLATTLGRHDDARSHFESALAGAAGDWPNLSYFTDVVEYGNLLLATGDHMGARTQIEAGLAGARPMGFASVVSRAESLLEQLAGAS